jgi:flagellar hook-associated protein 2
VSSKTSSTATSTAVAKLQAFNRTELAINTAAKPLNAVNASSIFNTKSAVSAKPEAVTATLGPAAAAGSYKVKVDQLAQGQKVQGAGVSASATSGIATGAGGYGPVKLDVNGKETLVSFKLTGTESNEQALEKIASAINGSGAAVTAKVTTDTTGTSKISLEGATGAANSFTVSDTVGNAAATAGVAVANPATDTNVAQKAQNAEFSVNGTSYQSDSNTATAGTTGVSFNLKQTTAQEVNVSVSGNSADVEKSVRQYVTQYNETLGKLKTDSATYSKQSAATLQALTTKNTGALRDAGINVGSGGELKIDEAKFKQTLETAPDKVKAAFNTGGGLARLVETESNRAINQSLASSTLGGFTGLSGTTGPSYGQSANQFIAQNIGLFMNNLY